MTTSFENLMHTVLQRKTEKVIAAVDQPIRYSAETLLHWDAIVHQAVVTAGLAPFHFERGVDGVPEPWRAHFLNAELCRTLSQTIGDWFELKPANKIPGMLAGCGCLVLVTWLPQFRGTGAADESVSAEKKTEIDDEHLAAAAAMVQNLLLLLTAAGLGTYWSSGGVLGFKDCFRRLGISERERLLAAVFVEYPDGSGVVTERIAGKNRMVRSSAERWFSSPKLT